MNLADEISRSFIDLKHPFRVLFVSPNNMLFKQLSSELTGNIKIEKATTSDTALQLLALNSFDLVLLQLKLPLFSGTHLAHQLKKIRPDLAVIPLCSLDMSTEVSEIIRLGYPTAIRIPGGESELIDRCFQYYNAEEWFRRINNLKSLLLQKYGFSGILSMTPAMETVLEKLTRIVKSWVPVLVTGESGTGKELVARMIHRTGNRNNKPFISVNCAAVPEGLLESQFFGHEKGAFTGATSRVPGKFEIADEGVLFLAEIGDMSPVLQSKFLRVLEYGEFERIGGNTTLKVNVRLITATNKDLSALVNNNSFRSDLFYRINVFPIHLPPLTERGEDIVLLSYHFLRIAELRNTRQVRIIQPEALELLKKYPWPGNIRELENAIERAVLLSDGLSLQPEDFPDQLEWCQNQGDLDIEIPNDESFYQGEQIRPLKEIERETILHALQITDGNISVAAKELGITRTTLYNKIKEHNLVLLN